MPGDLEIIKKIEQQIGRKLKQLKQIRWDSQGYVLKDNTITALGLSNYDLSDISFLARLKGLTKLSLADNEITDFSILTKLPGLTELDLWFNQIKDISFLAGLKGLTKLNLAGNEITDFSILTKLPGLTELDLQFNQIKDISFLAGLKGLTKADLGNNQIKTVPPEILDRDLEILWTEDWFEKGLNLYDNPIESPPIEIVKQGTDAVRNYFKALETEEISKLREAKLLIVGAGSVGKTCLMKRLLDPDRDINLQEISTEGIEINRWLIDTPEIKNFRVNFWDFGGQEIYHATHQFFLTRRSLYLFVWEARKDDDLTGFDYWLNVIKLLSDNSPVIMVMNKADEHTKLIDEHSIRQKFTNITDFRRVSALQGTGIDGLTKSIKETIATLPHIGDTLPTAWLDIRKKLESLDKNYISYDAYKTICEQFGLNAEQADYLNRYFHDLGVFLHFEDPPVLKETVFLKPDWATNAVYKVTDTKQVKDNFGRFRFNQLTKIWQDYPEDKHAALLELMKKFEICFQLGGSPEYIVPELLKAEKPSFEWDYTDNLRFQYHYEFMPAGIITRFIARTHDIHKKGRLYWKNGVILERENTQALVISDRLDRKIRIALRGEDKKALLAIIRREIDYIHETLNNPDVNEMLPCNCSKCRGKKEPHYYTLERIKNRLRKGRHTVDCAGSGEDVDIHEISGDIVIFEKDEKSGRTYFVNEYYEKGHKMKLGDVNVPGGKVIIAEHIDKIVYNENFGISKEQFDEVIESLKKLSEKDITALRNLSSELLAADSEEQKQSLMQKFRTFLADQRIPIAISLTANAITELAKFFL